MAEMSDYVVIGKHGRIVLPKEVRGRYGLDVGSRLIIREREGGILLIPVRRYDRPTEALYASIRLDKPLDEPKRVAREYVRRRLVEGL
jgi:AbrB family looped-hinge helix DNA binding protein